MLWSALLIHLTGGRVETHFHVFGSLAFLAFYRDWRVLVPATLVIATDHLLRQLYWPESVYGTTTVEWWRFLEHVGWVAFEDIVLVIACLRASAELRELARQHVAIEVQERAAAVKIQTSIVPRSVAVEGLEAAMMMETAETVGGDFYEVLPVDGGCWIAIGDVSGHGVRAGLTMLQAQSALGALVRHDPHAAPARLWSGLNNAFIGNVRQRLRQSEHMTLSLLRYHLDGRFEAVGAHEEILIWRHRRNEVELLPVEGTWIGLTTRVVDHTPQRFQLEPNDLLVLYTDGIIEARDAAGHELGIAPLATLIAAVHARPVDEIRDAIFGLAGSARDDDASVMVFRYTGAVSPAAGSPS